MEDIYRISIMEDIHGIFMGYSHNERYLMGFSVGISMGIFAGKYGI